MLALFDRASIDLLTQDHVRPPFVSKTRPIATECLGALFISAVESHQILLINELIL